MEFRGFGSAVGAGGRRLTALLCLVISACAGGASGPTGGTGRAPSPGEVATGTATLRFADALVRDVYAFPVEDGEGRPHAHPLLGGFDVPRPQLVDLDGDGDLDLFVQERTGRLIHFENTGSAADAVFTWRTDHFGALDIGEWSRFHDLDGDGDLDLLAEERFSLIRVFRNEGSPREPRFVLAADTLRDVAGQPIFADRQNIASLADIDCDGMVDLFLGRVDGTVARYEARSVENGLPVFGLVAERFEDIEIVAALAVPGQDGPTLHGANSMYFADQDGDGDADLFWGDYFEPGLLLIRNFGSCSEPDLRSEPIPVPADSMILTSGYNAPYIVDIDADGHLDLFVGVLGGAFNPNRTASSNLHLYRGLPDGRVSKVTDRFLDQVDVGSESVPALADLDGDGDLDLVIGNRIEPATVDGARLHVYENTGSTLAPHFVLRDTVRPLDSYHFSPAFADLDGDGRPELLLGTWNDDVHHFRDVAQRRPGGGWVTPQWERIGEGSIASLPRGSHSTPAVGDLDGDGDLDLLVGEASGEVNFFRNDGTTEDPRFVLVTETLDAIDTGRRSHPLLVDLDGDGDLDLVLGREDAGVQVLENVGSREMPRFEATPRAVAAAAAFDALLPLSALTVGDLDGDGDLDVLSGAMGGGLVFLRNARLGG